MKDIGLENEPYVVEDVLPPLAAIPPSMLGKAIGGCTIFCSLRRCWLRSCMLKHRTLQTHQQIRTADEFPPALDRGISGDTKKGPAQLIFRIFKAVCDPGAQAVGVANRFPIIPFQIGHDVPGALRRERLRIGREVGVADVPARPKDHLADESRVLLPMGEETFKRPKVSCSARVEPFGNQTP